MRVREVGGGQCGKCDPDECGRPRNQEGASHRQGLTVQVGAAVPRFPDRQARRVIAVHRITCTPRTAHVDETAANGTSTSAASVYPALRGSCGHAFLSLLELRDAALRAGSDQALICAAVCAFPASKRWP